MERVVYSSIYWGFTREFDLKPLDTLVLSLVIGFALSGKRGECFASKRGMAELLNISEPSIYGSIKNLIEKGLLERCGTSIFGTSILIPTDTTNEFIEEERKRIQQIKDGEV